MLIGRDKFCCAVIGYSLLEPPLLLFTCTVVSISFVPWLTGANKWSFGIIAQSFLVAAFNICFTLVYVWKELASNKGKLAYAISYNWVTLFSIKEHLFSRPFSLRTPRSPAAPQKKKKMHGLLEELHSKRIFCCCSKNGRPSSPPSPRPSHSCIGCDKY